MGASCCAGADRKDGQGNGKALNSKDESPTKPNIRGEGDMGKTDKTSLGDMVYDSNTREVEEEDMAGGGYDSDD